MEDIRGLLNRYPGTVALGEVSSEDSLATMVEYTSGGDRLHMAYSFELLIDEFSAEHIRSTVENFEKASTDSWPCWAFSNHDVMRVATRWGGDNPTPEFCKMLSVLIGSLKGSFCIYQGEELGLTEASLTYDQLQDPFGIAFWPNFKGRDGCRTPMPWLAEVAQGGFSEGAPWLPLSEQHRINAINLQHDLPASILNTFRRYMLWRKNQPALVKGDIQFIDTPPETLAFRRTSPEQTLLAAFNLSNCSQEITLKNTNIHNLLGIDGVTSGQIIRKQGAAIVLELPPFGMVLGELAEHPNMNTACS